VQTPPLPVENPGGSRGCARRPASRLGCRLGFELREPYIRGYAVLGATVVLSPGSQYG